MEGSASSTAPQPMVGGEEQGEVGLAVHGGDGHPGSHLTSVILHFQLLSYSELLLCIIAGHRQCDVCSITIISQHIHISILLEPHVYIGGS